MPRGKPKGSAPPAIPPSEPEEPPAFIEGRIAWYRAQIERVELDILRVGSRDVQGLGRMRTELRQLRERYDEAVKEGEVLDTDRDDDAIEAALVDALSEMDRARLARLLGRLEQRTSLDLDALAGREVRDGR